MNAPKAFYHLAYRKTSGKTAASLKFLNGSSQVYASCDTLQVSDYSRYSMAGFNEKHKRDIRKKIVPQRSGEDLWYGRKAGKRIKRGKNCAER